MQVNHPTIIFFAAANVMAAPRTQIAVLIGVKEHVALYPNRHGLLASEVGITLARWFVPKLKNLS
jgi:hypothetical protein